MSLAATRGNMQIAGFSSVKAKLSTSTEFVGFPLAVIRDGMIKWETKEQENAQARNIPYDGMLTAEFKVMATKTQANLITLLPNFINTDTDWQLTAKDTGIHFDSSLITAAPYFGCQWKLVADSGRNQDRHVQFNLDKALTLAEFDTIRGTVSSSTPDTNNLDNIASLALTDVVPAGIRKVEFGEGSYSEVASNIKNAKFVAQTVGEPDDEGRSRHTAIKIDLSFDLMQASDTELDLLSTYGGYDMDWKVTFADGAVCTCDSLLGVGLGYDLSGNLSKHSIIPMRASGIILSSAWAALWS